MPAPTYHPNPVGYRVEVFVEGLEVVWGMAFASDGRLFVTERPGRIRVIHPDGRLDPIPWKSLDNVVHRGESGLMGIALHPAFPRQPWVYIMYTGTKPDGSTVNRVSRIREEGGRGAQEQVLFDDIFFSGNHSGGRIRFGPDGHLYIGTGEAFQRRRSQDLDDPGGKILRLTPEGGIPADNPWPDNPVWAYGLRNVQGLSWHPVTGALFAADHGPSGEWRTPQVVRQNDEINIIEPGKNYGWPLAVGAPGVEGLEDPLLAFVPAAPPGDLLFYTGSPMPRLRGDLFFAVLGFSPTGAQTLMRIRFQDLEAPHRVTAIEHWFNDEQGASVYGRLRALVEGPDGAIYVGTSNRDNRERVRGPRRGDGRILRIVPISPTPDASPARDRP